MKKLKLEKLSRRVNQTLSHIYLSSLKIILINNNPVCAFIPIHVFSCIWYLLKIIIIM